MRAPVWARISSSVTLGFTFVGAPGGMAEQQGGGGGPGFEECSSIHGHSKQQAGALLKPKILSRRSDIQTDEHPT